MGLSLAEDRTEPKLTVAEDAIANADAYTSNAVLPTYSELLAALRRYEANDADRGRAGTPWAEASALLSRHDRTLAGDFGA